MAQIAGASIPTEALPARHRRRQHLWRAFQTDKRASAGFSVLLLLVFVAVFAGTVAPQDPTRTGIGKRLRPGVWGNQGNLNFPLGTDHLGRDVLSRLMYGSRVSLLAGLSIVAIAGTIGIALGLLAGIVQGKVAQGILCWVDIQITFPNVLLALAVLALVDASLPHLVLVLGLSNWMWYARLTYDVLLASHATPVAEAARALGSREWRIFCKHCIPNLTAPLLSLSLLELARMIVLEAALSFLGFGAQPPTPSWGLMVAESRHYLSIAPWLGMFAGLMMGITVLALHLVAAWMRTMSDPQQQYKTLHQHG